MEAIRLIRNCAKYVAEKPQVSGEGRREKGLKSDGRSEIGGRKGRESLGVKNGEGGTYD